MLVSWSPEQLHLIPSLVPVRPPSSARARMKYVPRLLPSYYLQCAGDRGNGGENLVHWSAAAELMVTPPAQPSYNARNKQGKDICWPKRFYTRVEVARLAIALGDPQGTRQILSLIWFYCKTFLLPMFFVKFPIIAPITAALLPLHNWYLSTKLTLSRFWLPAVVTQWALSSVNTDWNKLIWANFDRFPVPMFPAAASSGAVTRDPIKS